VKKLVIPALALLLSACQTTSPEVTAQLESIQQEIKQLKHVQTLIAQRVGLGELVRPEKISIAQGHHIGSEKAGVVLLEFTDLHCPFCAKFHKEIWPQIKSEFVDSGQLLFVGREYPLAEIHPRAAFAAVSLRCAAQQGKYEATKDYLFDKGQAFGSADLDTIISSFKLNGTEYSACLKDVTVHKAISDSVFDAKKLGLASTPTFILGKREGDMITDYAIVKGASSVEQFKSAINKLLQN